MSSTSSHHCRRSRNHRVRRLKQEHLPELWRDTDVVFTSTVGTPLDSSNFTYHTFQPLLKRVGRPKIRFDDLRHTCATLLLGQNVNPKIGQEVLGYANISTTVRKYKTASAAVSRPANRQRHATARDGQRLSAPDKTP
jgi:integrase